MKRETKYKVGDKVLIKENLSECSNVNNEMCKKYAGRVMTIEEINFENGPNYPYRMLEDKKTWNWGDNHIECRIIDVERAVEDEPQEVLTDSWAQLFGF